MFSKNSLNGNKMNVSFTFTFFLLQIEHWQIVIPMKRVKLLASKTTEWGAGTMAIQCVNQTEVTFQLFLIRENRTF